MDEGQEQTNSNQQTEASRNTITSTNEIYEGNTSTSLFYDAIDLYLEQIILKRIHSYFHDPNYCIKFVIWHMSNYNRNLVNTNRNLTNDLELAEAKW